MDDEVKDPQEVENKEEEQEQLPLDPPEMSASEKKARSNGWFPKDDWKDDPDDWVSHKKFNERGEMIGSIKQLKKQRDDDRRQFNSRLDNVNKMHEVMLTELESKRDNAIDMADRQEANKIQDQIDNMRATQAPEPQQTDDFLNTWNQNNHWITSGTPKAIYAGTMFNKYSSSGMSNEDAVAAMEADVSREFSSQNAQRDRAPAQERNQSTPGKKHVQKLTMNDLTAKERNLHNQMSDAWKDDAEFLQAVSDSRGAN